jgi:hypothetical protein
MMETKQRRGKENNPPYRKLPVPKKNRTENNPERLFIFKADITSVVEPEPRQHKPKHSFF